MGKSRREEKAAESGDYEFKLPEFDEQAFIRREMAGARASFYVLGIGLLAGVVSVALNVAVTSASWMIGWVPIIIAMMALRSVLQRLGFGEDVTSWKALFGSFFLVFFTGLSVWIIGVNVV